MSRNESGPRFDYDEPIYCVILSRIARFKHTTHTHGLFKVFRSWKVCLQSWSDSSDIDLIEFVIIRRQNNKTFSVCCQIDPKMRFFFFPPFNLIHTFNLIAIKKAKIITVFLLTRPSVVIRTMTNCILGLSATPSSSVGHSVMQLQHKPHLSLTRHMIVNALDKHSFALWYGCVCVFFF